MELPISRFMYLCLSVVARSIVEDKNTGSPIIVVVAFLCGAAECINISHVLY